MCFIHILAIFIYKWNTGWFYKCFLWQFPIALDFKCWTWFKKNSENSFDFFGMASVKHFVINVKIATECSVSFDLFSSMYTDCMVIGHLVEVFYLLKGAYLS